MTYSNSKKFILVGLLLFGLVGFFGLPSAQAVSYGGLGIHPNESEVDEKNPRTKSWFIYTLELGEVKKGKVDIVNSSSESVEVKVYPVDAVTTKDGAFAPQPEDREKIDVGAWIRLAESEVSLGPKETKTIDFTLKVPENAEVGDHMGAIIVQAKELPEVGGGTVMRVVTRIGSRMYITIPGDIVKELEFTEFTRKKIDEKIIFSLTFVNNGNVRIKPKGEIEITNIFGKTVDTIKILEREVFPKREITIPVEWEKVPALGKFTARASVVYDANKTLTQELTFWFLPKKVLLGSGLAGGIAIIILLTIVIIRKIRGRREKKIVEEPKIVKKAPYIFKEAKEKEIKKKAPRFRFKELYKSKWFIISISIVVLIVVIGRMVYLSQQVGELKQGIEKLTLDLQEKAS